MAESDRGDRLRRRLGRALGRPVASAASGAATGGGDTAAGAARDGRGRKTPGKMRRAKPPNVRGRGPLLDGPGLGVAVVAIVKDEADYLEEWLAYHIALGVDHFFIYDNRSTDGSAELLERYINHGYVTRIDWPLGGGQLAAYNHSLRMFGRNAEWLAYYDPDEYLVPLLDDDIPTFLARFPDAADVRVPRVEIGFSGHRHRPAGLTIDNYTQVADVLARDPGEPARVKSIVRPGAVSAIDIHLAFPADVPPEGGPTRTYEAEVADVAQRFRGSATGRIARPAVDFDLPTLAVNDAASRFSARTQATLDRLARLDPRPYTYGSGLAFEYFPRPNDLFRFGEFALANWATGLDEPRRAAAIRLVNHYDEVGIVADLSDQPATPVRDALSGSAHVAALVEHMRGRIVTSLTLAPELSVAASNGHLTLPEDGPAMLTLADGIADLVLSLPDDAFLRCYTLGFLLACPAPLRMVAEVVAADGSCLGRRTVELPAASSLAGLVEVQDQPIEGRAMRLHLEGEAGDVTLYDLFVIANG
jgi:Glycosyltransferase family 92